VATGTTELYVLQIDGSRATIGVSEKNNYLSNKKEMSTTISSPRWFTKQEIGYSETLFRKEETTMSMTPSEELALLERRAQNKAKTTSDVVNATKQKYMLTKEKIEKLKQKKASIEKEIEDLERKQKNRKEFISKAVPPKQTN
jgi:hypothetical protein